MSWAMIGQSVDIDFGKHEAAHHILLFEFWDSVLAPLGAAVQIESSVKTFSEVQTNASFLSGR